MAKPRALITGVTGQDGSYLAELLLSKGYEVHGFLRPDDGADRLPSEAFTKIHVSRGFIEDYADVAAAIRDCKPGECYHLAAQTFVPGEDLATMRTNTLGSHHVLAAIREHSPACRMFLAGSGEMFGDVDHSPQNEATPMRPRNVYGISKVSAYLLMRHYRQAYGLHASCGFLYNHESPRRGEQFVTGKIIRAAARIKGGAQKELRLGNLDAVRDWGDARDYVEAMWLMLQHPVPDDYVIATGKGRTVRDLLNVAFGAVDLDWREYVTVDERFYRPSEKYPLIGDATKAEKQLCWSRKRDFDVLIREMVSSAGQTRNPQEL